MKWRITAAVVGSKYLGEVEAATEEEAIKKAETELSLDIDLCHQCDDEVEDAEITELYAETEELFDDK